MGFIFITHGAARIYYGSVGGFGEFLNSQGILLGVVIAWIITRGEMISGSLMIAGILVKYLVIFHGVIILSGIILVNWDSGRFTVGFIAYLYSKEE